MVETWEGTALSWANLQSIGLEQRNIEPGEMGTQSFYIKTEQGLQKCEKGDLVIREILLGIVIFYPCKPDVFKEIYEEVAE